MGEHLASIVGTWIERACRLADADVCAIANLTDDEAADSGPLKGPWATMRL